MRSFLDPRPVRRPKRGERFRGRYGRGQSSGHGGKKLIRYRRNRELMAREFVTTLLWLAIAAMLFSLTRTLWHVAQAHLAQHGPLAYYGLPGLALCAAAGCLWRARRALHEFLDIRREQRQLVEAIQEELREVAPQDEA
jgi:hypothetical protein